MGKLNIVQLIEQNPITKLTGNYQNKLLKKLQEKFTGVQQQLFVSSFYGYLNCNKNDFVIDLTDIWLWLGFSRKDSCKVVLEKHFIQDIHYKIVFQQLVENPKVHINIGGRPKEQILMTLETFKKLSLKSGTKKADEIHDYMIILEESLQETIAEESNELKLQLEENKQLLLENQIQNVKEKHDTLLFSYHNKSIVYILKVIVNNIIYYKFGFSNNIKKRVSEHRRLMKCQLYLIFCIESISNVELEMKLKDYFRKNNNEKCRRINLEINNYEYTEFIETNDKNISNICSLLIDLNKNIGENIEDKKEILNSEKEILNLEDKIINLKIQYTEIQKQNFYIKDIEIKLSKANERIIELSDELKRFKPIENEVVTNQHYSNEMYKKFINENCDLIIGCKCSGIDLINSFKNSLQNTIYEAKINSYYNEDKFTKATNYYLPSFKKEFYKCFEKILNYKASAMKFRNNQTQKSKNQRGFAGIRLKSQIIQENLYDKIIYQEFMSNALIRDSYEQMIKTKDLVELFISYLDKNMIKIKFKKFTSTIEYTIFHKEFIENICIYFNIKEQRIKFPDYKSSRPGFHYIKMI